MVVVLRGTILAAPATFLGIVSILVLMSLRKWKGVALLFSVVEGRQIVRFGDRVQIKTGQMEMYTFVTELSLLSLYSRETEPQIERTL